MINNHVKEKRIALQMSQLGLAKCAGVSRQTVVEIENGSRVNVTTETLRKLADALNCSIDDLI